MIKGIQNYHLINLKPSNSNWTNNTDNIKNQLKILYISGIGTKADEF